LANSFRVSLDFSSTRPIYLQIIDEVGRGVARNSLAPGDKLPSQRELAEAARVNPNTVQRAYREMEAMGLVETRRGEGTFIREDESLLRQVKSEMAKEAVGNFIQQVIALGLSEAELLVLVTNAYQEAVRNGYRGGDQRGQ